MKSLLEKNNHLIKWSKIYTGNYYMDKSRLIDVAAVTYLLVDRHVTGHPQSCNIFLRDGEKTPTTSQIRYAGGIHAIRQRVALGRLDIDQYLGVWNSGFISGLRNSGCLLQVTAHSQLIYANSHKELFLDLKAANICSLSRTSANHIYTINSFHLLQYPSEQGFSKEYIAGLLAGSYLVEIDGLQWLALGERGRKNQSKSLVDVQERSRALKNWGILYKEHEMVLNKHHKKVLLISPFYGALFSQWMPVNSFSRMMGISRPAMCPELGLIYWNICVREKGDRAVPLYVDELPFVGSYATNLKNAPGQEPLGTGQEPLSTQKDLKSPLQGHENGNIKDINGSLNSDNADEKDLKSPLQEHEDSPLQGLDQELNKNITSPLLVTVRSMRDINVRRAGIDLGILRVSSNLRDVLKEWAAWHKTNRKLEREIRH